MGTQSPQCRGIFTNLPSRLGSLISKFHNYIGTLLNKLDSNLDPHSRLNADQILEDKPREYSFDDKNTSSTTDQTESETNEDVSCKSSETENEVNTESETSEESISEADIDKMRNLKTLK